MSTSPSAVRSPSYPSMSLRDAISAVRKIEAVYRTAGADREQAAGLIGYSSLSGPAAKALAALAQYNLVERAGKGELRVTSLAVDILHADSPAERAKSIERAAFGPKLFSDLLEKWPDITPPLEGVESYLRRQGYNERAIRPAAAAYLDTLEFIKEAEVYESHGQSGKKEEVSPSPNAGDGSPNFGGAKVGDLVQWESDGMLQFQTPKSVRWISDDGLYLAVEGSQTSVPMSQVIVEKRSAEAAPPRPPQEQTVLSPTETDYKVEKHGDKLFLSGTTVGVKGIETLISELELYKQMLGLGQKTN